MDASLYELIKNSRAADANTYTHVSYYGPNAKWYIKSNELTTFWQKYCELVNNKNGNYCLGEKAQDIMPILAKGTLKFYNDDIKEEAYGNDFITSIVYCYQQAILELFEISDSCIELICCVLEPEKDCIEDGILNCQFLLQFPYCRTDAILQTRLFRQKVIQILRSENVISRLSHQPINDWENILDPLVSQEPLPLYKSTINQNYPELILKHIYGKIEHEMIDDPSELELMEVFTPKNHNNVLQGLVTASLFSGEIDYEYWLPMFLSINYWNRVTLIKPNLNTQKIVTPITSKNSIITSSSEDTPIEIVTHLIPLLSRERVETDHFWIDIGKSLYNIDNGGDTGLNLWIRFTEKSDNHSADECRVLYQSFNSDNPLTLKTIAWYARKDSPDDYNKWHSQWCITSMEKATSCSHADVATALYRVYWLDFICSSLEKKRWYHFQNHKWFKLDDGITLRQYISSDFIQRFEKLRTETSKTIQDLSDDNLKSGLETTMRRISELIKKLKTFNFKNTLMKEVMEHFYDPNFDYYVDTNINTMGLVNCVLETCDTYACVRDGKPEDYISRFCPIIWKHDLHWKHDLVQRCMKWLRQVFTNPDLLVYFLRLSSSCLKGKNSDKKFPILTGEGDNSKSMLKKLFEATFGPYCHTFPNTLFTNKRNSGPSPEIAQAKGTRICFMQEPDDDDSFRNGIIKELTGGDRFFARLLNDNGGNIEATFKLFLMCNKVPLIPNCDKAVKNRLRILPFLSTWVNNPPDSYDEQFKQRLFKKDPFFEKQIPELATSFLWILVQTFEKYITDGLKEPSIIVQYTDDYRSENDVYQQFMIFQQNQIILEENHLSK